MLKRFKTEDGSITIEVTEEGKVTYSVGKKKTTFDLCSCGSITYEYKGGEEKMIITKDMLTAIDGLKPWLWLVISEGEDRLEYNNNQAETRRHYSYCGQNDKTGVLASGEDVLDGLIAAREKDAVRAAIRSLDSQQQELVLDLYYRGLSKADISRRDGVTKAAVTYRMKKIFKRLRFFLCKGD